jgi:enterochelin esterase family protein
MQTGDLQKVRTERTIIRSVFLQREVKVDLYLPPVADEPVSLLLINDGQDLEEMKFAHLLDGLVAAGSLKPLLCVGIHAGSDRKNEYGTARELDFAGRGTKAKAYCRFVLRELIPFLHAHTGIGRFAQQAIAGFSLGGLSAMDIAWNNPGVFTAVGVFSGSFWWRSRNLGEDYDDDRDRIMHQQVRRGKYQSGLRFYFTTGSHDETADRNKNGIIDSIEDTQDIITELEKLGYDATRDIRYVNYEDGHHDVATWGRAMPAFLLWSWGAGE